MTIKVENVDLLEGGDFVLALRFYTCRIIYGSLYDAYGANIGKYSFGRLTDLPAVLPWTNPVNGFVEYKLCHKYKLLMMDSNGLEIEYEFPEPAWLFLTICFLCVIFNMWIAWY